MSYETIRRELRNFYWKDHRAEPARAFADKCAAILEQAVSPSPVANACCSRMLSFHACGRQGV